MDAGTAPLPGHDLAGYLRHYPREIALGDTDTSEVFDRLHTPDFLMVNDGAPLDRGALLRHVGPARRRAADVEVDVRDAFIAGNRVAARYTLTAVMRKGQTVTTEICMLGTLAEDGRLRQVHQFTRDMDSEHARPSTSG